MTLALVREMAVPVTELRRGMLLILPSHARVVVQRVDQYGDEYIVRWKRRAEHGEPGFRRPHADPTEGNNGWYYGSTVGVPATHCWRIDCG